MPRVLLHSFIVPQDVIDANAHVNNKEYLRWMEEIAIAQAETLWIFVDIGTGRATEIAPAVRDAFSLVGDDDPEIAALARLPSRRAAPAC